MFMPKGAAFCYICREKLRLEVNEARRLKRLEEENAKLKRIVADQLLENQALKEIARGNF